MVLLSFSLLQGVYQVQPAQTKPLTHLLEANTKKEYVNYRSLIFPTSSFPANIVHRFFSKLLQTTLFSLIPSHYRFLRELAYHKALLNTHSFDLKTNPLIWSLKRQLTQFLHVRMSQNKELRHHYSLSVGSDTERKQNRPQITNLPETNFFKKEKGPKVKKVLNLLNLRTMS